MPKTPIPRPTYALHCDPRLPQAALAYRRREGLLETAFLNALNVTAWLYQTPTGSTDVQVNPNVPIREIIKKFGPAATPDAEVGFHSEGIAGQWFTEHPEYRVLQIFSERIPCRPMCAPMLQTYFPGVPWYYYYDRETWREGRQRVTKWPAEILRAAYGL